MANAGALREFHLRGHETHVEIKADLNNLGWILVQIGQEWFVAKALQNCFDGISYDQWEATARELRLRHRAEAAIHEQNISEAHNAILEINTVEQKRFGAALKRLILGGLRKAKEDLFLGLTILPEEHEAFGLPVGEGLVGHVICPASGKRTVQRILTMSRVRTNLKTSHARNVGGLTINILCSGPASQVDELIASLRCQIIYYEVYVLAKLFELEAEDHSGNSAMQSLLSIFRSWAPQISANVEQRIAVLDLLVKLYPGVGCATNSQSDASE
ncbi:hypothetical protein [Leisingera sp. ANG59]|uniref:hypothetical protein n=1 Tax=Leisingera sp. ANG59 TaxID=2675221 RepID=UPI0015733791|nr:hypothetical protein [Leisingera sp. ANG59]NSY37697.1 hypothetical protein [Leisingera sp. ANG59]